MTGKLVFGMCNPILDVILRTTPDRVKELGLKIGSTTHGEDEEVFKLIGNIISSNEDVSFAAGGSLLNSLRVCKELSNKDGTDGQNKNKDEGISVFFSGGISDDSGGILLQELLTEAEIEYEFHITNKPNLETGKCVVFVTDIERTLLAGLGAAKEYSVTTFESERIQDALKSTSIFAASGFFIEVCFEAVLKAAQFIQSRREKECSFIFGLSAVYITENYIEEISQLFPMIDYLIGNQFEFASLYKNIIKLNSESDNIFAEEDLSSLEDHTIEAILTEIHKYLKPTCVLLCTRGHLPVVSLDPKGSSSKIQHHECIYVPKEKLVDVNGCGDAFKGGFIYGLSNSFPLNACIYMGHYAASTVAQNVGCNFEFDKKPSLNEILSLTSVNN
ncbi:Cgd8-2370-like protein [Cryptosporidium felis]|nr:Cgd8-2370-like protein [Cryptosporidium felis]